MTFKVVQGHYQWCF